MRMRVGRLASPRPRVHEERRERAVTVLWPRRYAAGFDEHVVKPDDLDAIMRLLPSRHGILTSSSIFGWRVITARRLSRLLSASGSQETGSILGKPSLGPLGCFYPGHWRTADARRGLSSRVGAPPRREGSDVLRDALRTVACSSSRPRSRSRWPRGRRCRCRSPSTRTSGDCPRPCSRRDRWSSER